ncbi:hypothetical protein BDV09DRAFT_174905 [Aspergillus tetrazonus]
METSVCTYGIFIFSGISDSIRLIKAWKKKVGRVAKLLWEVQAKVGERLRIVQEG